MNRQNESTLHHTSVSTEVEQVALGRKADPENIKRNCPLVAQVPEAFATLYSAEQANSSCETDEHIPASCSALREMFSTHDHCRDCMFQDRIQSPMDLGAAPLHSKKPLFLSSKDLSRDCTRMEQVLADGVFVREGQLVALGENPARMVPGSLRAPLELRELSASNIQLLLSEHCQYVVLNKQGSLEPSYFPVKLVNLFKSSGHYPSLRPIRQVTEVPTLRPDGTVLQTPGYDEQTQVYFAPTRDFPLVQEEPLFEDARGAIAQLREPFVDFPISETGEAVLFSTVLTAAATGAFRGRRPGVLISANIAGTGKSMMANAVGLITKGRSIPKSGKVGSFDEERRQFTALLKSDETHYLLDNITDRFGGRELDRLITSDVLQDRVLGSSHSSIKENKLQIIATGNNIQIKADTKRRCLRIDITSRIEHPEQRCDFRIENLEEWLVEHHPRLLVAALTILRAYIHAGKPKQDITRLGSFESWGDLIQSAVKWSFGHDPADSQTKSEDDDDLETQIIEHLMCGWRKVVGEREATTCRAFVERMTSNPECLRFVKDAFELAGITKNPTAVALGMFLRTRKERIYKGNFFTTNGKKGDEGVRWMLQAVS